MKKHLLTTGEFAKLCGTQKGTLLFYDKEGLLKPKHVSENGYRYYEIEQYFEFDLLSMLKEVGSSLKEIKTHLRHMDGESFLSFLEEKQVAAKRELNKLKQRTLMLGDMTECLREALNFDYDVLIVEQQEKERLEVTPTGATPSESRWELVMRFVESNDAYKKQEQKPRSPFGFILGLDDVRQGNSFECYSFHRARRTTPRSRLHVKPEGKYATLAHKGTNETHRQALAGMLEKIDSAGMVIKSDIYVYDMVSYVVQETGDCYALKYCVLVE
ncbi:MerR family transcriptional regulator [Desulfovibrio inopinatus]|uniref:MerR family transcriptional regulator n=1 Tax=Desulfovibrio inopinatus TaxID=102109 RepID=UPI000A07106F|nr:MerR family transcriptional regulator [Desulfovibrio inopinatus]